jgi:adenylosuccinate synthase
MSYQKENLFGMNLKNKADVLLGLQWGDEGKGKVVDVLAPEYKVVARFQGGPNAGHTLEFESKKYVLHTIPSGIFHPSTSNIIGSGVVMDPVVFSNELQKLGLTPEQAGKNLIISRKAHLILPSHRLLDAAIEASKGNQKIGSTLKGIGPTYTDKTARNGLRIGDCVQDNFQEKYQRLKNSHLEMAKSLKYAIEDFTTEKMSFQEYEKKWMESLDVLRSLPLVETEIYLNQALDSGMKMLAEGAQGSLLDIDFGSYPFVTSSSTIAAGACIGLGLPPSRIGEVFGIFKAYCTRVGSGPFATELFDSDGDLMRKQGNEFGSTTGRPRRCGWLDLPALKYSVMLNGVTRLIMTKADVLSVFSRIKVCTSYIYNGTTIDFLPTGYDPKELSPSLPDIQGMGC